MVEKIEIAAIDGEVERACVLLEVEHEWLVLGW